MKYKQRATKPLADRFWPKVHVTTCGGCWLWTGSTNNPGYGQMSAGRRGRSPLHAHRVAWELFYGPPPEGLDLDHLCRNRACVNPSHLEPVTRSENLKRSSLVGQSGGWPKGKKRNG